MAKGEKHIVVLQDTSGNTYILDSLALQDVRVPVERKEEVEEAIRGGEVAGGALRLTAESESPYKIVGSFRLQHAGGLDIASMLRAL